MIFKGDKILNQSKNSVGIKFNCVEEFKTKKDNITEQELKVIFNEKFFYYIQKKKKDC